MAIKQIFQPKSNYCNASDVFCHFHYSHYCITMLVCVNNENHNWMINIKYYVMKSNTDFKEIVKDLRQKKTQIIYNNI